MWGGLVVVVVVVVVVGGWWLNVIFVFRFGPNPQLEALALNLDQAEQYVFTCCTLKQICCQLY